MNDVDSARENNVAALQFGISPLHVRLRSFELLLKIGYKADLEEWKPRGPAKKQKVADKKKEIQRRFRLDVEFVNRFAVITTVLALNMEIDEAAFESYANDTAKLYNQLYSWYPMSPSVHKVLMHGKDFLKNSLVPLGGLSEEAQESLNKYVRSYRQRFARKFCRTKTNTDVFQRLMIFTDPLISSKRKTKVRSDSNLDEEVLSLLKKTSDNDEAAA
ncbi:hypothetical protein FOCC_FOCC013610 [Frankliniella occidentalis]|nr:hypothetical protein FOCC_FOCC013610 [Frankliniella occidentalis]